MDCVMWIGSPALIMDALCHRPRCCAATLACNEKLNSPELHINPNRAAALNRNHVPKIAPKTTVTIRLLRCSQAPSASRIAAERPEVDDASARMANGTHCARSTNRTNMRTDRARLMCASAMAPIAPRVKTRNLTLTVMNPAPAAKAVNGDMEPAFVSHRGGGASSSS